MVFGCCCFTPLFSPTSLRSFHSPPASLSSCLVLRGLCPLPRRGFPSSARTTAAVRSNTGGGRGFPLSGVSGQRDAAGAAGRVSRGGRCGTPGAGEGAGGRGWDPGTKGFVCPRAWGHRLMLHGLLGGDRNLARGQAGRRGSVFWVLLPCWFSL